MPFWRSKLLKSVAIICAAVLLLGTFLAPPPAAQESAIRVGGVAQALFETSDRCMACHNGLTAPSGEDISIGFDWRASMMANSARDPYWQAGVRRELIDHPEARAAIEGECSICHMPMATYEAKAQGREGQVFGHLPFDPTKRHDRLAADGVSCSTCHQITEDKLGTRESFVGGFVVDTTRTKGERPMYGPFEVDSGHTRIMRSASGFQPTEATHIRESEMCGTCHTLYTQALGPGGQVIGELPEQMPYLEWVNSAYREEKSCQACHMPVVTGDVPITSVLGKPREGFSRHTFVGGNFFMQRMLNRYRDELDVVALSQEMEAAAARTIAHLQSGSSRVQIYRITLRDGRLLADFSVENLGGHKLPTAYPSRRVWLHVVVRDRNGGTVFESGSIDANGRIVGNDNDADPGRFEPHYTGIDSNEQVQIYEAIMGSPVGLPTTGLLTAVRYLKDNRLLPRGFDKAAANRDIAVQGGAAEDEDFTGGSDRIRYSMSVGDAQGPFRIEAALRYQPISFRWAENLRPYDAMETQRFVRYYESMAHESSVVLASASATSPPTGALPQ
jgi:hypothetical protein